MYVELSNGKDSFREQRGSPRRNVQIELFICPPGQTNFQMIHLGYQHKLKGLGKQQLMARIPATSRLSTSPGFWYNTRYEMIAGTMVIVRHIARNDPRNPFNTETTDMLLEASDVAPLYSIACDLPPHFMSDINTVMFVWRFNIIHELGQLEKAQADAVMKFLSVDEELADALLSEQEVFEVFSPQKTEGARVEAVKTKKVTTSAGKETSQIRRVRRIKIKS